jgi:diguanylate cyclase (GGDEF)-like protein
MIEPKLEDEGGRLAALHRYEILDTPGEEAFDRITSLVKTVLNVKICAVSLIDAERQWFKSCAGLDARETGRDVSICTHTIRERRPFAIPDTLLDHRFAGNPLVIGSPFIRSYLGVPLSTPDGYNIGSLCVIDTVPRSYTQAQIDVLQRFAALVTDELELRRIAHTDHLTGAMTRRGFTLELEKALLRFQRSDRLTALVLLDVDHFKQINDTYGHPTGDVVLNHLAQRFQSQLRRSDTFGRLGGEEFGILLEDVNGDKAREMTERLRVHLESSWIPHAPPLNITASFGIAIPHHGSGSAGQWLAAADRALYEAKRTGRNRCCHAGFLSGEVVDRSSNSPSSRNLSYKASFGSSHQLTGADEESQGHLSQNRSWSSADTRRFY